MQKVVLQEEELSERSSRVPVVAPILGDELLEKLAAFAEVIDDREVPVDHRVEQRVEEQAGRLETALAEALLDLLKRRALAVVDRDDRVRHDEDRELVILNDIRRR